MSFAAPIMLFALLGAAVPILIHLIHKKRPRKQRFAAIELVLNSVERLQKRWRLKRFLLLLARVMLLSALALAAWLPAAFGAGFSFDDREAIEGNGVVDGSLPWSAAFERDYWEHRQAAGHFRPWASLLLRCDHALWGERALGFHLTNALLHAAVHLTNWIGVVGDGTGAEAQRFIEAARTAFSDPEQDGLAVELGPTDEGLRLHVKVDEGYIRLLGLALAARMRQ